MRVALTRVALTRGALTRGAMVRRAGQGTECPPRLPGGRRGRQNQGVIGPLA